MAELDFPDPSASPWDDPTGKTWIHTGFSWVCQGQLPPTITVGPVPPVSPQEGDLWWDSNPGVGSLKVYYDDGTSAQWVSSGSGAVGPAGPQGADGNMKYTVVPKSANFTPAASDGKNILYYMSAAVEVTIPTATAGGFNIGDVVTLIPVTAAAATIVASGTTLQAPEGMAVAYFGDYAFVSYVYLSDTLCLFFGDLNIV